MGNAIKDWNEKVSYVKKYKLEIEHIFGVGKLSTSFDIMDPSLLQSSMIIINFADMFGLDSDLDAVYEVDKILRYLKTAPKKAKDVPQKVKALSTIGDSAIFKRFKK